jgi:TusE/DsrC/DsvC family sulfur relay protein
MTYSVNGTEIETDGEGYVLDPNIWSRELTEIIAAEEGITLTDAHWEVINYMREEYAAHGHTPNFRGMVKGYGAIRPGVDSKYLYSLFPAGPAKQAAKVAGLPQPYGKGGY